MFQQLRATFGLIYSGIVNGHQLLCDAQTLLEQHRGTEAIFSLLTIVLFCCFFSDSPISFLGCLYICINNLTSSADLILWFPDKTSVCTKFWHQNDLILSTVPLNIDGHPFACLPLNLEGRLTSILFSHALVFIEPKYLKSLTFLEGLSLLIWYCPVYLLWV